jgi:hypothetical protein
MVLGSFFEGRYQGAFEAGEMSTMIIRMVLFDPVEIRVIPYRTIGGFTCPT